TSFLDVMMRRLTHPLFLHDALPISSEKITGGVNSGSGDAKLTRAVRPSGQPSQRKASSSPTAILEKAGCGTYSLILTAPSGSSEITGAAGPDMSPAVRMMSVTRPATGAVIV